MPLHWALSPSMALWMSSASIITTCSGYSSFFLAPSLLFFLPSMGGNFTCSSFFFFTFFSPPFSPSGLSYVSQDPRKRGELLRPLQIGTTIKKANIHSMIKYFNDIVNLQQEVVYLFPRHRFRLPGNIKGISLKNVKLKRCSIVLWITITSVSILTRRLGQEWTNQNVTWEQRMTIFFSNKPITLKNTNN